MSNRLLPRTSGKKMYAKVKASVEKFVFYKNPQQNFHFFISFLLFLNFFLKIKREPQIEKEEGEKIKTS